MNAYRESNMENKKAHEISFSRAFFCAESEGLETVFCRVSTKS